MSKVPVEYYEKLLKGLLSENMSAVYTDNVFCDHYLFYLKDSRITADMVVGLPNYLACYTKEKRPPLMVYGFPNMFKEKLEKALEEYQSE